MNKCDYILKNEEKYSQNAELIDVALNEFTEHGPPQHVWDQIAPGTYACEQEACAKAEGIKVLHTIEQEDLDANEKLFQQLQMPSSLERFTTNSFPYAS